MRYKLLGPSGLRVSELCLGTMSFGDAWGFGADEKEAHRILGAFADAAGNSRKSLRASVDASLRRLRTDYLDVLWLHAWDYNHRLTPEGAGTTKRPPGCAASR